VVQDTDHDQIEVLGDGGWYHWAPAYRFSLNSETPDTENPGTPSDRAKIASDGASTGYYRLPDHADELRHLISYKGMSKSRGDIFKACYRLGEKQGVDVLYDLNKMKFFVEDLIEMHKRGEHL
jgi:hypothetical protein